MTAEQTREQLVTPEQAAPGRSRSRGSWPGVVQLLGITRRSEASAGLTIGTMLAVIAALVAFAPGVLRWAEGESLDQAIEQAAPQQLRLSVRTLEGFEAGTADDPTAQQRAAVSDAAAVIPEPVLSRFGEPRIVIDSPRFVVDAVNSTPRVSPTTLTLRVHPDLDDHSRIVAGRAASPGVEIVEGRPVVELELSSIAADVLGVSIGDVLQVSPDTTDPVMQRFDGGLPEPFGARLVGLRELDPADDPYWFGDVRLHRPVVSDTNTGANYTVFGSIPAAALPERPLGRDGRGPLVVEQRRDLVPETVSIGDADELLAGLDALAATSVSTPTPGEPAIVTGFGSVLRGERAERAVTRSSVVLAAVGMVGVAAVTLVLCLQVALHRRRGWLGIARARGVSARQVVAAGTVEMAAIAAVAVTVGALVARVAHGAIGAADLAGVPILWLVLLWLGAVLTTAWTLVVDVRGPLVGGSRTTGGRALTRTGRIAVMLLVVATIAALVTFLRRGVADGDGVDVLAVLVPLLLPLVAGLAAGWALPILLGPVARSGMSLGPGRLVGTRRAMGRSGAGPGLVAVLTMAVALAGLGVGVSRSLESGITDASWRTVGAPFTVGTNAAAAAETIAAIEGIELAVLRGAPLNVEHDGEPVNVRLLTIDADTITDLTEGTAADPALPAALGAVDSAGRVPVVSSSRLDGTLVRRGDIITPTSSAEPIEFVVADVRDELFGRDGDWIVADAQTFESASDRALQVSALYFDLPRDARSTVDEMIGGAISDEGGLTVGDRAAAAAVLRADPLVQLVRRAYVVAAVVGVVLALTAVAALAVLTARQRRREVGLLRLLGASHGETGRAVRSELVPPCLIGIVLGSLLGWWLATAFDGRFDLSAFAGDADVTISPRLGALVVAALVAMLAIWAMLAVLQYRADRTGTADVLNDQGER